VGAFGIVLLLVSWIYGNFDISPGRDVDWYLTIVLVPLFIVTRKLVPSTLSRR